MRVANSPSEFMEMLESAKRESVKSFGDDRVILEKYIQRSRYQLITKIFIIYFIGISKYKFSLISTATVFISLKGIVVFNAEIKKLSRKHLLMDFQVK